MSADDILFGNINGPVTSTSITTTNPRSYNLITRAAYDTAVDDDDLEWDEDDRPAPYGYHCVLSDGKTIYDAVIDDDGTIEDDDHTYDSLDCFIAFRTEDDPSYVACVGGGDENIYYIKQIDQFFHEDAACTSRISRIDDIRTFLISLA